MSAVDMAQWLVIFGLSFWCGVLHQRSKRR